MCDDFWFVCLQELREKLEEAQEEVRIMKESMDKQKELARAIVNQRDMYRTLLAQATPLPPDTSSFSSPKRQRRSSGRDQSMGEAGEVDGGKVAGEEESDEGSTRADETKKALEEMKEQFEAYKKEKKTNDAMVQEQMDKLREENSETKMDRAKLASKVNWTKDGQTAGEDWSSCVVLIG